MTDAIYRLDDVRKKYNRRQVLRVDTLQVSKGEILGVVGPSGGGKSTLLRLLNFLEPPSKGTIYFKNVPFRKGQPMPTNLRRQVTTVFQQPCLLNRTVTANVRYGLRLRRNPNSHELVDSTLEQVGLYQFAHQRAKTLSGGEAQRVALARALVIQPDVLLLDEPTANLDPYNVGLIEQIIVDTNINRDTTIVLVTHNIFQAKRLAHRVAFLLDGRIIEINDVHSLFESPDDERTAAFIGGEMVY